ncbi:iron(III) transport system ATP-binding protein [Stella humosa]|uniref:Iron(III) transport system ATP-binding protein n=1 Tax=Stella humosa TaxID=94 RepID=A0A3N1MF64_9PROT|nr:ABC transporter ATP-binding protein [Stella humosa]ROQ01357.1 iron(III) transport system ATP-binding protein [Stella humosa]BBK31731.1 spermidine/putrescine ABC transporter ATPase [Stella humosa]
MSADLTVEELEKSFAPGIRPAVDRVSFHVPAGEIVVLLGPSGCGKTTTLRMVAGLERPTGGMISIGGRVVARAATGELVSAQHREVGMVFQSYAVWPHMTVQENVAYPLRHRKVSRADIRTKVAEALQLVGLEDYASRSVTALSGGQMQRVALARALVYRPQLLLLDEPLSNLDAKLRLRLRDDLRRIIKEAGVTALYVTHDQAEAVVLGDRIGVMRDGHLLQMTDPVTLYNRPADLFVANFTGASNMLDGRIGSDGRSVELAGGARLAAELPEGATPGVPAVIAIRPENLMLAPPGSEGTGLHGRIVTETFHGTQTIYRVEAMGSILEAVEMGTVPRFAPGADVTVQVPASACRVFVGKAADRTGIDAEARVEH